MEVQEILLYTVLAIVLLYVLKKIYKYMNENFVNTKKEKFASDMIEETMDIPSDISQRHNAACTVCQTDLDADTYIRKRLLAGRGLCNDDKRLSNNELKQYRDKHFAFKNKVWQSSRDVDMVDKVNYMYLSGNEDLTRNHKGVRISDLFNTLTKNDDMIAQDCSLSSDKSIERLVKETSDKVEGHNGQLFSDAKWEYNNEKVMNGGKFYGDIHPYSGTCNLNQAV